MHFTINSILAHLNSLKEIIGDNINIDKFRKELLVNQETLYLENQVFGKDDYVFYPVFSGVDSDELKNELNAIFGIDYGNIRPLQRFDTNKGWRFIVPQKNYNQKLKGKKVILLDMGSFTGDSIIQMIDSLCAFELKKIVVISLIGRLEDFNREFFSRIRELKVKKLASEEDSESSQDSRTPINIYFGTNLHFPASRPTNCEHCKEIDNLKSYLENNDFKKTDAEKYIQHRINILDVVDVNNIVTSCPNYFPKTKEHEYDIRTFFTIRDYLGKIDGYRFYRDYYDFFDRLKEDSKKDIEAIIAVTLHEKHLVKTISNQLPDVKKKIVFYIEKIINGEIDFDNLFYKWKMLSILESYFLYAESSTIFEKKNIIKLFNFIGSRCEKNSLEFYFVEFKMVEAYHNDKNGKEFFSQSPLIKSVEDISKDIEDRTDLAYYPIISNLNRIIAATPIRGATDNVQPFYKLFYDYNKEASLKPTHGHLGDPIDDLIFSVLNHQVNRKVSDVDFLSVFCNDFQEKKEKLADLLHNIEGVSRYLNLHPVFVPEKCHADYFTGNKSLKTYLNKIDNILNSKPIASNCLDEIKIILYAIQREYFQFSSNPQNFYAIWKNCFSITVLTIWENFKKGTNDILFNNYINNNHKKNIQKLGNFEIIVKDYQEDGVCIFPFFLIMICKELIDNSVKYAKGADIEITITNETNKTTGIEYTKFFYSQNKAAKGKPKRGLNSVDQILKDFGGTFYFNDTQSNALTIEITIPNKQFKNNNHE